MEVHELAQEYEQKSDDELLRLAVFPEELTPEAEMALKAELAKRRLDSPANLDTFRQQEQERRSELEKNIGSMFLVHPAGIGRERFGRSDYSYDAETGMEQFKTTVFVVLFWMPLIPTGTYRVERRRRFSSAGFTVLEKLPLDWEQILKVWVVAAAILLGIIWTFDYLIPWWLAFSTKR